MIIGIQKFMDDLQEMGFENVSSKKGSDGIDFAIISNYQIPAGSFASRIIDLAIPVPQDYPRMLGSSIHVKANPHLLPFGHIAEVRNIIPSSLGNEWQYWSYAFHLRPNNPSSELISQINEVFRKN